MIGILLEAATFQFCMSQERDVVSCHVRCFYISCFPLFFSGDTYEYHENHNPEERFVD